MKFVPHVHHTKVSSKEAVVQDNKANNYSNSSVHSSLMVEQNRLEQKKATSKEQEVVPNGSSLYEKASEAF